MTHDQRNSSDQTMFGTATATATLDRDQAQDFGSNAAQAESLGLGSVEDGGGSLIPDGATRDQLIQHAHRAMAFLALRQREGVEQFERDAVLQDPPPYVDENVVRMSKFYMTAGFELIKKGGEGLGPVAGFVITHLVDAAKDYAETWIPDLVDPSGGKITVDVLEDLVDQTAAALDACWNMSAAEFINQQTGMDDAALHELVSFFDSVGPMASELQYGACLGGWVDYCGRASSPDAAFDPSFVAHLGVYADHVRPGEPVPATLRGLPAVGEELQKEMLRFSVGGAQIRLRVTDPMGMDFVVEPSGRLIENNSTGMGRHYLYCLGGNKPDLWKPGEPPRVDPSDPEYDTHVTNGAQLLALQYVEIPLSQFPAGV